MAVLYPNSRSNCFFSLQVFEVAPSLHMVELRKTGGDTLEFHKACHHFSLFLFLFSLVNRKRMEIDSFRTLLRNTRGSIQNYCSVFPVILQTKWICISPLTTWQFYKSFSSGLKDIVWKSEGSTEEQRWLVFLSLALCLPVSVYMINTRLLNAGHEQKLPFWNSLLHGFFVNYLGLFCV